MNVLGNPEMGVEGVRALVGAVEQTPSVVSLVGVLEGQRHVDLSGKGLGPLDAEVLAAEFRLGRESTRLAVLDVSQNSLFLAGVVGIGDSNTLSAEGGGGGKTKGPLAVSAAEGQSQHLLDELKRSTSLERLDLSETGMSAKDVVALAAIFRMPDALACLE